MFFFNLSQLCRFFNRGTVYDEENCPYQLLSTQCTIRRMGSNPRIKMELEVQLSKNVEDTNEIARSIAIAIVEALYGHELATEHKAEIRAAFAQPSGTPPAYSANPDQHSTHNIDGPSKPTAKDFREQLKERKQRLAAAKANFVQSMDKLNEELVYLRNDA